MSKEKLDRNRPYGSVHGSGAAHSFEQDNIQFDHSGNQVGSGRRQRQGAVAPPTDEVAELRARIAELEAEKRASEAATGGPGGDSDTDLATMGVKALQAEHKRRTGKGFPPGTKPDDMRAVLQQMRDAEAAATEGTPAAA